MENAPRNIPRIASEQFSDGDVRAPLQYIRGAERVFTLRTLRLQTHENKARTRRIAWSQSNEDLN